MPKWNIAVLRQQNFNDSAILAEKMFELFVEGQPGCMRLAAGQGFEPRFLRPERSVLPLHHPAISSYFINF